VLFAILVAVAILTTAAAMPIYRASLPGGMDRFVPEQPKESSMAAS
jgi:hypothetical protein